MPIEDSSSALPHVLASPTALAGAELKADTAYEAWAAAQAISAAAQKAAQRELSWDTPLLPFGPVLVSLASRGAE